MTTNDYYTEHQIFDEMMAEKTFNLHLNIAKGDKYDFVTHTWNPIKGLCPHQCKYCTKRNLLSPNYRCKPVTVEKEFKRNLDEGKVIFVGSSIDLFAKGMLIGHIMKVLEHCAWFNQDKPEKEHIVFLFQSKDPARVLSYVCHPVFKHAVVATTLETNRNHPEIMGNAPTIEDRVSAMEKIAEKGIYTMVSVEPLMDFDKDEFVELIRRCKPRQVYIGRNTARSVKLPEPTPEKVRDLIATLSQFTRVKLKKCAMTWLA